MCPGVLQGAAPDGHRVGGPSQPRGPPSTSNSSCNEMKDQMKDGLNSRCHIAPLKKIEYGVYGDLIMNIPKAIFYLLKGDYSSRDSWEHKTARRRSGVP